MQTFSVTKKRIVTCQGTIQLVTALSVMACREREEGVSIKGYDNYLVIYGLFTPPNQTHHFLELIKKIANAFCSWKSIVFLDQNQIDKIGTMLHHSSSGVVFKYLYDLVNVSAVDEIYLCRNWQLGNQLLINAFESAHKICYGDSVGLYFSEQSSAFFSSGTTRKTKKRLSDSWHYLIIQSRNHMRTFQAWLGLKTVLGRIEFDQGYFALPDAMGELPSMPKYKKIDSTYILDSFRLLLDLVDSKYVSNFQEFIGDSPVVILLTSNFSEAGRMSSENELLAYQDFITTADLPAETTLVIKPHPRDSTEKIEQLEKRFSIMFDQVILLSEPQLFYLPFEIFFLKAFGCRDVSRVKVFSVSSACLSLKLLFGVSSTVGFSREVTSRLFFDDYKDGRLIHENDLRTAVRTL